MANLNRRYKEIYKTVVEQTNANKFLSEQDDKMKELLNTWSGSPEMYAQVMLQYVSQQTTSVLQSAQTTTVALLKAEYEVDTIERKTQGYDDNIIIKLVEAQGGVASFAVNSGSDDAQGALDKLKGLMCIAEKRVSQIVYSNSNSPVTCA